MVCPQSGTLANSHKTACTQSDNNGDHRLSTSTNQQHTGMTDGRLLLLPARTSSLCSKPLSSTAWRAYRTVRQVLFISLEVSHRSLVSPALVR